MPSIMKRMMKANCIGAADPRYPKTVSRPSAATTSYRRIHGHRSLCRPACRRLRQLRFHFSRRASSRLGRRRDRQRVAALGGERRGQRVARANALENNVSLYYTESGSRKTIKYVDAPVARDTWHTLRAEFSGRHIRVILDGVTRIELDDAHIAGTGAVGVWTKADSVTLF